MKRLMPKCWALLTAAGLCATWTVTASAQTPAPTPAPERSQGWATASTIFVAIGAGTELLMPRIYYAESESTLGWKARWHMSVLAPIMTLTAATVITEYALKPEIKGYRPGCDETNQGGPGCSTWGAPSTHALAGFASLGHGAGVFVIDTLKWNDGRFHGGAFVGHVVLPLLTSIFAAVGRVGGEPNHESGGQIVAGAGVGFGAGLITGGLYALLQRPECGYGGGIVCW